MKCPICGNEKFLSVDNELFRSIGEDHQVYAGSICLECGHIEYNGLGLVSRYKELKTLIKIGKENVKKLETLQINAATSIGKINDQKKKTIQLYAKLSNEVLEDIEKAAIIKKIERYESETNKEEEFLSSIDYPSLPERIRNKKIELSELEQELSYFKVKWGKICQFQDTHIHKIN